MGNQVVQAVEADEAAAVSVDAANNDAVPALPAPAAAADYDAADNGADDAAPVLAARGRPFTIYFLNTIDSSIVRFRLFTKTTNLQYRTTNRDFAVSMFQEHVNE